MPANPVFTAQIRARIAALGELSRPLGEARAEAIAGEVARSLLADMKVGRNPDRALDAWLTRIACEIAANASSQRPRSSAKRTLKDLLPEIG